MGADKSASGSGTPAKKETRYVVEVQQGPARGNGGWVDPAVFSDRASAERELRALEAKGWTARLREE